MKQNMEYCVFLLFFANIVNPEHITGIPVRITNYNVLFLKITNRTSL